MSEFIVLGSIKFFSPKEVADGRKGYEMRKDCVQGKDYRELKDFLFAFD